MNLCFVCSSYYPAVVYGGTTVSNYNLTKKLAENGISVSVSTTNANGKKKLNVSKNIFICLQENLNVKYYDEIIIGRFSLNLMLNLWKDIKKADVVNLQDILSTVTFFTLFYSAILNKPVLISPSGSLSDWCLKEKNGFLKQIWLKYVIKPLADKQSFHATSIEEMNDILKIFPMCKVFVVPNGIDLEKYKRTEKISLNSFLSNHVVRKYNFDKFIISISRLHIVKGYDILIKAFIEVQKKMSNVALIIAGNDDGAKEGLKKLIKGANLEDSIFIIDYIDGNEKMQLLSNADVFALCSHSENFGNVYAEALACGTPILATKNTPWENVERYNCGKWVENNEDSVSTALIELLQNDKKKMGDNGIEYIKKFSWSNVSEEIYEIYKKLKIN